MPDILTEAPAQPSTPVPPAPPSSPAVPGDDAPLSAHIEAFKPESLEQRTQDNAAQTEQEKRRRHRAAKDLARPEDVPRIRELTGKVKDVETRAEKAEREAQEWRTKYEALTQPKPAAAPVTPVPSPAPSFTHPPAEKFTYPTYDEAVTKDPATTWEDYQDGRSLALYKWNQQREQYSTQQEQTAAQRRAAEEAEVQRYQTARQGYDRRMLEYVEQYPDRRSAFENVPDTSGAPLFNAALILDDNSAEMLYRLRQQPDVFDEAVLFAYGKPVDESNVARMQRWLQKRLSPGTTGAGPVAQSITPAPRPPTPVRTTPVPPTDEPPGDAGSLRDHAKHFHKGRR